MTSRLAITALLLLTAACNKTSFGGTAAKKPAAVQHGDKEVTAACNANPTIDVSGTAPYSVTVKGSFCDVPTQTTAGAPTVMFLIDVSGSMAQNDPPQDGTCGRLAAAQAILNSVGSANGANLGYVSFADYVEDTQQPITWSSFQQKLDAKTFCSMKGGATNYQAALDRAGEMLKFASGPKVIYFISDGLPTRAGENPSNPVTDGLVGSILIETIQKAGLLAASALRNDFKDLSFFAIYLDGGDGRATAEGDGIIGDAKDYLAAITGSPEAVRLVSRAQDLAEVIMSFKPPLKPATTTAAATPPVLATAGGKPVPVQSVKADGGQIDYVTAPIVLDQAGDQKLIVDVVMPDGTKKSQSVDLRFTPKAP
jgi:hypothetical protein